MPQTKFVTQKALALGLKPMVVVNKVDKHDARTEAVHEEVFDLFAVLDATDDQLDFPTLYASGRDGWASYSVTENRDDLAPLFDLILSHVPVPEPVQNATADQPFTMLASLLERDSFLGRILTGRVEAGTIRTGDTIKCIDGSGKLIEQARVSKLLSFEGIERVPVESAEAGDIVAIAGFQTATVAQTLCATDVKEPLKAIPVDPPTLAMTFRVNDGPFAGREGDKVTSRMIRDRLLKEADGNVAIRVSESHEKDSFEVAGRGELQLGVLIETMRREGFELTISRPRVIYKDDDETGGKLEPMEEVQVDVDEEFSGIVVEKLSVRKAELTGMQPSGGGKIRLSFLSPSRGLIGYHGEFLTDTRGTGIMNRSFHGYAPHKGAMPRRRNGVLISNSTGKALAYALFNLEDRGAIMIDPNIQVYESMIIGEHSRENDLEVNPLKGKQLTNIRAAGKDEAVRLTPPMKLSLEAALAYINDDELVEVTPESIRLRKRLLDPHARKRESRAAAV